MTEHESSAITETPWVNPRDPALALGADGLPARSRRAPQWVDVPDEKWNDWRWQLSNRVNTLDEVGQVLNLTDEEREGLTADDKFRVDITPYFASLIDPDDPNDPIRRQVIPLGREHEAFTAMMEDSLAEDRHSPVPGLVHRYPDRVLMLVTTQCASYCRYCTRSRIVGDPTQNFNRREHEAQLEYLRRTPQVRDVLISGGDGLTLAPKLLESIIRGIREIPHIEIIRIGSRVPVFLPQRVDDELCEMLARYHPLWINLHFNHPNEITPEVSRAVDKLSRAGIPIGGTMSPSSATRMPAPSAAIARQFTPCEYVYSPLLRYRASTSSARWFTGWWPTGSGPITCTSATSSRARAISGRRSARDWRSSRGYAATPAATRCRPTSSMRPAAAARSR